MLKPEDPVQPSNARRRRAVELRLSGHPLPEIRRETGLSAPTIIAAYKAFVAGGWDAVAAKGRGRRSGVGRALTSQQESHLRREALTSLPATACLWSAAAVRAAARHRFGVDLSERTVQRMLARWGLVLPTLREAAGASAEATSWVSDQLPAVVQRAHAERAQIVWCAPAVLDGNGGLDRARLLVVQTLRGATAWLPAPRWHDAATHFDFVQRLRHDFPGPLVVLLHGAPPAALAPALAGSAEARLVECPVGLPLRLDAALPTRRPASAARPSPAAPPNPSTAHAPMKLTHLQRLEAESIHVMREVVAECERPVMLYSIGKDSACMLHLAKKAFHPSPPPFPLLHVDTTWKFRDMYAMRSRMADEMGMELLVWQNPEAKQLGINPFDHGSQIHTDMWKTQGLKQALDHYGFDAAFGGARRDEEKSRAKERIFSFRSAQHRWDPKQQRPELWRLYNARKHKGESIRVFPLSNWTELDIWQYIHLENIPIVPLYFAKERPVVERDGTLIMVDDGRMPLRPGEVPLMRRVRFRTLGCYPLSGAIESDADSLTAIIQEMLLARTSERQGRVIDHDQAASMEKKKQEGYF
jgi:sulfate adenylyltransferase subunit 2